MHYKKEEVTPCLLSFEIQVEPERYAEAVARAKKELGKRTEVPGFRKGKAPAAVLDRVLDPERIASVASEYVMPDVMQEILEDLELEPWDVPTAEPLEPEAEGGFAFKALVPLRPSIELGNYKGLEVRRFVRPVTDEIVERELERLQKQNARLEPRAEGGAEEGDYLFVSVQELSEQEEPTGEPSYTGAVLGENVPDFDHNVKGMTAGETKDFVINYPQDWGEPERAGRSVKARVNVSHIYQQVAPEVNDEFAKSMGDFESLDKLKEEIRTSARTAFDELANEQVDGEIITQIIKASAIHYPPQMMEGEFNHRVRHFFEDLKARGMGFEEYLSKANLTEEQFRERIQAQVDGDIKVGLVLSEIGRAENIEVTDDELKARILQINKNDPELPREYREYVGSQVDKEAVRRRMQVTKVMEFLRNSSNIKDVTSTEQPPKVEKK